MNCKLFLSVYVAKMYTLFLVGNEELGAFIGWSLESGVLCCFEIGVGF